MTNTTYPLFDKIKNGQPAINVFLRIASTWTAEMISHLDFDAITLDLQHSIIEPSQMMAMVQALRKDRYPMARLASNEPAGIMRCLDAGVKGLICPMVDTKAEAESFLKCCYYPPDGIRSYGPFRANVPADPDYLTNYRKNLLTFVQIETAEGLKNVEDISTCKGLSGLYLGPYDLSIDLGYKKVADFSDPTFMKHVEKVLATARKNKLIAAVQAYNENDAAMLGKLGFDIVTPVDESAVMVQAVREKLDRVKRLLA